MPCVGCACLFYEIVHGVGKNLRNLADLPSGSTSSAELIASAYGLDMFLEVDTALSVSLARGEASSSRDVSADLVNKEPCRKGGAFPFVVSGASQVSVICEGGKVWPILHYETGIGLSTT
jgi:hypothetical protein